MTRETFEKIYTQFIDGTSLVNHISIYKDSICIVDKFSSISIYYCDIDTISVNKYYYQYDNDNNEYKVVLDIILNNDSNYKMEVKSNL